MIAALAVGGLIACSTPTLAQETNAAPAPKQGGKKGGNFSVERQMERLKTGLDLTDEQTPKVKAAVEEFGKALMDARSQPSTEDRRAKMMEASEAQAKKMKEILTPEQFQKWQKMVQTGRRGGQGGPGGPGGQGGQGGGAPKGDAPKTDSTK
jgi:Spy/CpxP family protein refolding chaperone